MCWQNSDKDNQKDSTENRIHKYKQQMKTLIKKIITAVLSVKIVKSNYLFGPY